MQKQPQNFETSTIFSIIILLIFVRFALERFLTGWNSVN
jgi:hypothetical protein